MTPKQKIILQILGALLFIGAGLFAWWFLSSNSGTERLITQEEQSTEAGVQSEIDEESDDEASASPEETPVEARETKSFVVDAAICDAECAVYQGDAEASAYCQAVCGLPSTEGAARPAPADCANIEGVNKDICLRDKAVADKNGTLCEEITDKGLRESCRNRLAEERFD